MTKLYYLLLTAFAVFLYSCKSASKAYQKGDYRDAIELGVKKLQKDPGDRETRDLVQSSYDYMVTKREDQIRQLSNSRTDDRFEKIYSEYAALQNLYKTIHLYPSVSAVIKTKDYSEHVATYRDKAADVHSEKAEQWMNQGTKKAYREAYNEFRSAIHYRPDDVELRLKRDEAYDLALTKVIISPIQNYGGNYQHTSSSQMQDFQRDVIRTLTYNMNDGFVKFYSEWEARNQDIDADQVMDINFSRISMGRPNDNKSSREVSKQVVVKETVYKPDSVIREYATVKAMITSTKRVLVSRGDLIITLRDTNGRTIWSDRFTGEHKWETEFHTYTGDERALSESDRSLLNNKNNSANPPSEEVVLENLLDQIEKDLSQRLRTYYSRL